MDYQSARFGRRTVNRTGFLGLESEFRGTNPAKTFPKTPPSLLLLFLLFLLRFLRVALLAAFLCLRCGYATRMLASLACFLGVLTTAGVGADGGKSGDTQTEQKA